MDQPIPTQPVSMLWHYLRPYRGRVLLMILLLLAGIGLQLLAPQLLGRFVDTATAGGGDLSNRLYLLAGLFFLAVVIQKGLRLITVYLTEDLGWATTNALRADLTGHVLRLDMGFHKLRTPGELIERIDGDIGQLAEYFSEIIVNLIGNGLLVIGILALVFWADWRAGLVALTYAVIMVTFLRVIQNRMVRLYTRISQAAAELLGFMEEHITGTEDVIPNGGAPYVLGRLYPLLNTRAQLSTRTYTLATATGATSTFLFVLALAATMALAASAYLAGTMTIGTVFVLIYYVRLLESPLDSVRRELASIQRALASVNRTREFFDLRPEVTDSARFAGLPDVAPGVVFDDVSFAYKDRLDTRYEIRDTKEESELKDDSSLVTQHSTLDTPSVLHDISFTLAPGQVLGVLGRTGSGKTTLTRLLFRLYDVDVGAIRLGENGGTDVRELSLVELRRHVGMVTQDVQLFAASVRDNLTLFNNYDTDRPPVSDEAIVAALETLGLGDWYRSLSAGLDTVLESGAKSLSAGEAQLLAFTRVFLRDPLLVVLDEASSRLDPATEQLLERAIDKLLAGRTGIVIAHRLKTVGRADDILILEDGRVIEYGPRAGLAADPGSRFYRLLQTGLEEVLA
jgi:ATP-binding cassette, subfamily B, bacterial